MFHFRKIFSPKKKPVKLGIINKNKPKEIYSLHFEEPYFQTLTEYYTRESVSFIEENGVSSYMKKAKERLFEEEMRAKTYLDSHSIEKCKKKLDSVLIEQHKQLLQRECANYLDRTCHNDDLGDLHRMYQLLSRIEKGIEPMLKELELFVKRFGNEQLSAVNDDSNFKDYTEALFFVNQHCSNIVSKAFLEDVNFVKSLDKALREVINSNNKSPEYLAKYCDNLLKKGKNSLESGEVEKKLAQIVLFIFPPFFLNIFYPFFQRKDCDFQVLRPERCLHQVLQ